MIFGDEAIVSVVRHHHVVGGDVAVQQTARWM